MPTIKIESDEQLSAELSKATGKVVLAFQKSDCEPCENDKANLEAVAAGNPDATILTIDVEAHDAIAERYGAEATPTYLVGDAKKCSRRGRGCVEVPWAADLGEALKK